jgi:hypothetical protein
MGFAGVSLVVRSVFLVVAVARPEKPARRLRGIYRKERLEGRQRAAQGGSEERKSRGGSGQRYTPKFGNLMRNV